MIIEVAAGIILAVVVIIFWRLFVGLALCAFWLALFGAVGLWIFA